jgi:AcrR family transcriptional regulator
MSQIAEETSIGRATLYKYFSDVEAILIAWRLRQCAGTSNTSPKPGSELAMLARGSKLC